MAIARPSAGLVVGLAPRRMVILRTARAWGRCAAWGVFGGGMDAGVAMLFVNDFVSGAACDRALEGGRRGEKGGACIMWTFVL